MRTKILLCAMLGSMGLPIYPSVVGIENASKDMVFVQVNSPRHPRFARVRPQQTISKGLKKGRLEQLTFIRVKGHKQESGTIRALKKIVDDLAKRYGGLVGDNKHGGIDLSLILGTASYQDDWSRSQKQWSYKKDKIYTIKIPELEQFTVRYGQDVFRAIRAKLTEWGHVTFR